MPGVNWEAILLRKLLLELNKHSKVGVRKETRKENPKPSFSSL
jgi:hypothetical protein